MWLIAVPYVFNPGTATLWTDVVIGALVASFAGCSADRASRTGQASGRRAVSGP